MGKITESKHHMQEEANQAVVEETLRRLEIALELKKQGKEDEGDKALDDIKDWLEEMIQGMEREAESEEQPVGSRSSLPQSGEVVAEGKKVILGVLKEDEKEKYLAVSFAYSYMKSAYNEEKFREATWDDFLSNRSFVCSIYEKVSREYVGYCSIKSLVKNDWELAMELEPDACHKGYGTEALLLFMELIHRLTGTRFFRARVEIDNHVSQGLMKKIGATPNGISEFLLHGEDIEKFQKKHKDMITDEIRAVAVEFCMEAEDILGYVLEYRIDWETIKDKWNA